MLKATGPATSARASRRVTRRLARADVAGQGYEEAPW